MQELPIQILNFAGQTTKKFLKKHQFMIRNLVVVYPTDIAMRISNII